MRERALRLLHTKVKTGGGADLLTKVMYVVITGPDPCHFDTDPDPWIRTQVTDPDPRNQLKVSFLLITFCGYIYISLQRCYQELTKQLKSRFFLIIFAC